MFKKVFNRLFGVFTISIFLFVLGACDLTEEPKVEKIEGIKPNKEPILRQIERPEETLPQTKLKLASTLVWNSELRQCFDYEIIDTIVAPYSIWKPRRHFGPFFDASFDQIQILINGNAITWYHNNFFIDCPDSDIYQKYYYTTDSYQFPPTEQIPSPEDGSRTVIPGRDPTSNGVSFGNILLTLHSISYSSLYGGSIRLLFYTQDDTEIELRSGETRWDIYGLRMSVFVVPNVDPNRGLNPREPLYYMVSGGLHIDFDYQNAVRYTGDSKRKESSVNNNALRLALKQATSALNTTENYPNHFLSFNNTAVRFAYGFFHSQFQERIGPNDAIDSIELTEGYADIWTHERMPVFYILGRIKYIVGGYFFVEENEFSVKMSACHIYSDGTKISGPSYSFELSHLKGGSFRRFGNWEADECENIVALEFKTNIVERDPVWDDDLEPLEDWLEITGLCSAINQAIANNEDGTIEKKEVRKDLIEDDDKWGWIVFEYEIGLIYR